MGYRLFIIHPERQSRFDQVTTLADLAKYTALQGTGWADIDILEAAGLPVQGMDYGTIFRLINLNRADYFPTGATEVLGELKKFSKDMPNLRLEKNLVLIYPFAMFYFVNKKNQRLHDVIYEGLINAHADGSYEKLFKSHPSISKVLKEAMLSKRRRLEVDNPLMSDEIKQIDARYWYRLQ